MGMPYLKSWVDPLLCLLEKSTVKSDTGYSPIFKAPLVFGSIFGLSYVGLTLWNNWYREQLEEKRDDLLKRLQEQFKYHDNLEKTTKFQEEYQQLKEETETTISQITLRRDVRLSFASQITSMAHALSVICLAAYALWSEPHWNDVNTSLQNKIAMWSLGYFIFDIINVLYRDFSWEFLFHHICTSLFWLSCYYLNLGGYYGVLAGFVGEITNPVQIIWSFARKHKLTKLYKLISPIFTFYFLSVRCLVIPTLTAMMNYHIYYISSAPKKWKMFWIFTSWAMNMGSWYWCYLLWKGYSKFRKAEQEKKLSLSRSGDSEKSFFQ